MKPKKNLLLLILASVGCFLLPNSSKAVPPGDFFWTGSDNNGTFDDANNFAKYLGTNSTWTNGVLPPLTGNPAPIVFGYTGGQGVLYNPIPWNVAGVPNPFPLATTTQTVTFDSATVGHVLGLYVQSDNWTFNLGGGSLAAGAGTTPTVTALSFGGNNSATSPTQTFTPTVQFQNGVVNVGSLTLGANGSSNNIWGGPDETISFASNASAVFTANSNITIGSADGTSTGNIFNGTAGQILGSVTVNAGTGNKAVLTNETSGALSVGSGASAMVNGGAVGPVTVAGGTVNITANTVGGLNLTDGSTTVNGSTLTGAFVWNSGALTMSNITWNINTTVPALVLGAGLNLTVSGGSIISTGGGSSAVSTGIGSTFTVDGTQITAPGVNLMGDTTIQNGGSISTSTANNLGGNLGITSNGSFTSTAALTMASSSQISVTDGGAFQGTSISVSGGGVANINVDASSSFNASGTIGGASAVNITGGGTVSLGNFTTGVTNVGDVDVNTGTGKLVVSTLNASGPSIGTRGNVVVTNSLVISKGTTMTAGDVLEFNGDVAISATTAGRTLTVDAGAVISGQGRVSFAATNGAGINLNGGTVRVGDASAVTGQTLAFNNGAINNSSVASTFEFSLYDDGSNDQIQVDNVNFSNLNLKLDLVGDLATLKSNFDAGLTTFTLFTDLNGNALGEGQNGITLDSSTIAAFAAEGYSVDTSMLDTNGSITLDALSVPEPSTWALLFVGSGLLVFFQRRRASRSLSTNV